MDAKPFAREIALLSDPGIREAKVLERLRELPVDAAVELLHDLVRLAEGEDVDARIALPYCVGLTRFEKQLGYEWLAHLYVSADDRGYAEVKRLLATSEVSKRARQDGRIDNEYVEKTLGERKELARKTRDRDLIDRLLFDRNPEVVRQLLGNPRVVERDAVKIAAMRPTTPAVLEEVLRHPKWSRRYAVQKALALNPYLPANNAISLLRLLVASDLRQAEASTELARSIRDAARDILARRGGDDARGGEEN